MSDKIEAEILDALGEEVDAAVDTPLVVIEGPKGDTGAAGQDGHSPAVTATKSGKTTTISVDGAAIATVEDGADGAPGAKGADGITPTIGANGHWYLGPTDTGKPSRGETGPQGTPGKDGVNGETGPAGPRGEKGADGSNGKDGKPGEKGADGAPGIYYGTTPPTGDTHPVWIDPGGDHDDGGLLPAVTDADNGKFLRVVGGAWSPVDMPSGGGIHDVSWHTWDTVIVPEGGLNAFDFTTSANGEKLLDHQVKGMFIYSPSAASTAENDQTATLTVNGDYVFSLATFARKGTGYLRLLLTVEDYRLIVRYYKRDTDNKVTFPATTVTINLEDLHNTENLIKGSTTVIGYGQTLKAFNQIKSVRIESSGQVAKDVEFDVQVMY